MTHSAKQNGFGLVEIMIALTIGLFLMSGVIQIFISSKQTYRANEGLAQTQERGRFAVDLLARELRSAGYKGSCGRDVEINNLLDPDGTGYHADLFDLNNALRGWNNSAPDTSYAASMVGYEAGTDSLLLQHAATGSGVTATGNTPANANTISLDSASGIAKGAIIVISDDEGCDIFQNRSNSNASNLTRGHTGEPGNLNPGAYDFSHQYDDTMEILAFRPSLYYIGTGASGLPALRRTVFNTGNSPGNTEHQPTDQELVDGILDMQITYGEDSDGDGAVNPPYVAANSVSDWEDVVAARVCVVTVSSDENAAPDALTLPCNGVDVEVPDNRLAQVFTTTIALRNRLP